MSADDHHNFHIRFFGLDMNEGDGEGQRARREPFVGGGGVVAPELERDSFAMFSRNPTAERL